MLKLSTGLVNKLAGVSAASITKITNGLFTTNTAGWTAVDGTLSSVAGGQSGNCLQIAATSAAVSQAYQDFATRIGHLYILKVFYKNGTGSTGAVRLGVSGDINSLGNKTALNNASWTELTNTFSCTSIAFIAAATSHRLTLENSDTSNTGLTFLFDTVSIMSVSRSLQDIFYKGFLDIYQGTQPASADTSPAGSTLLCTIYSNGSSEGLSFDDAVLGVLSKKSTETWTGTAIATGSAGWFRLRTPNDSGNTSTTDERMDGQISTAGAELNFNSTTITSGAIQSISTFQLTVPTV